MQTYKTRHTKEKAVLLEWWDDLMGDKGAKAALRRCRTPAEAIEEPSYHRLRFLLTEHGYSAPALQSIAIVASHVRDPTIDTAFSAQLATPQSNGRPVLTDLRFRRLLRIENNDHTRLLPALVRILRAVDGKTNLPDLAQGIRWWNDQTKQKWAFTYYDHLNKEHYANNRSE